MGDRNLHVVDAIHLRVDARLLESAEHAETGNITNPQFRDFLSVKLDRPSVNGVIADNRVEQRGFATSIRSDDTGYRSTLNPHAMSTLACTPP